MSADRNKATFLGFVEQLRKGNLEIIDEVCSPTFAFHSPNYPDWPRGLDGARQLVTLGRSLYKDAQTSIEDILAEGDKVAVRWTIRATYNGASRAGFPNPGERVTVGSMSMYRFVDGKIEDDWGVEVFWPLGTQDTATRGWVNTEREESA
jgi:predicted ester cyclase